MTKRECAIVMAFTGTAMLRGDDLDEFYKYVAEKMGRPVYTHEMAMLSEEIKEAARNDFLQLCQNASEEVKHPKIDGDRIRPMTDEPKFCPPARAGMFNGWKEGIEWTTE